MTAAQMLKKAGFPNTEAGRKAFYKKYPTKESFMKKYAKGGDTEAFPQQPDSNQFFNMGVPATFPGPFYAHGGSHMPLVHYQMAGQVDPRAAQAMMDNQGGNIPFATRQPGGAPVSQLPRFENGGMDPKAMAEQILAIREAYGQMTPRELKKELENIQEEMASGYASDPTLPIKQTVIAELLGQEMPMAQTGGIAFPQQPDPSQFFTGAHFNNNYRKGGAPCYKCGGMYDTGGNTPFNYGYFPLSMGGGGYVGLDTTDNSDYLTYAEGGESPQGFTMQDFRNNRLNQFKGFLANTAQAYNAGQVIQQGQMEDQMPPMQQMPPQNAMGGYNAMMPAFNMNYGSQYNTDSFSMMNPNAMAGISAEQDAIDNLTKEGAGNQFMGQLYNLQMNKFNQKQQQALADKQAKELMEKNKTKAKYGYFLTKHQTQGVNNQATNTGTTGTGTTGTGTSGTGTGTTPSYLTREDVMKILEEQKKASQQSNQQQNQGFYNPYFQSYQPAGFNFMGAPRGSKYKLTIRGDGTMPFFGAPGSGTQGTGTQGTGTQGQGMSIPAGMNMDDFSKYMDAMNKSGFKGELKTKMGLLGRWLGPRKQTLSWSFGNPAAPAQQPPVQGPIQDPNAKKTTTTTNNSNQNTNTQNKQYKPGTPYDQWRSENAVRMMEGLDTEDYSTFMNNQATNTTSSQPNNISTPYDVQRSQNAVRLMEGLDDNNFAMGGYNNDVVWMDEDDIRRFEAGGGVLEYLDGGEFKQYY